MRFVLAAAVILAATTTLSRAQEILLQNDSFTDGDAVNICPCFTQGEEAAVWLTSPCDGNIVGIQIFWKSLLGGTQATIEDAIVVYRGGSFPNPGLVKKELLAPVMTDGFMNEYRYEDDQQVVPIRIPVSQGEEFVVSLKFFNENAGNPSLASIVSDTSGCQQQKNAVKVNASTWMNACSLGVSGDWVIRAIVECGGEPSGACCLQDGSCESRTETECNAVNGDWHGAGTDCADIVCLGACYIPSTEQCLQFDKTTCDAVGGDWQGPGTTECSPGCEADINGDGVLDFFDVADFLSLYGAGDLAVDFNGDGVVDFFDVSDFLSLYAQGCL